MQAIDILKKYWGYTSFKLNQEEVINSIISNNDTLALLPTSGGKSICFQIPSLMQDGICLVISPLISLMKDQTKFLKSKGIKSVEISSQMNTTEIETALTNCIYGNIKFLYISPERLRNQNIIDKIDKMNINLIAVDEAHCISKWGNNFRPSYRQIFKIREIKKDAPILALTATANKEVIEDIQSNLLFKKNNVIKSSFFRKNISYVAIDCKNKKKILINVCNKIKSSIIIYVGTRKESKELASILNQNSISASSYHAGLEINDRSKIQESWVSNNTRVIVATSAFGMGINKLDVRLVVHVNIPNNIESYFQESGRAGRDDKTAYSIILYEQKDLKNAYQILEDRYPSKKSVQEVYQKICDHLKIAINELPDEDFDFNISNFCEKYKLDIKKTYSCIRYLEKEELIKFNTAVNKSPKIKILLNNSDLYKFQIANSFYDNIIKVLQRKYSNILKNYSKVNLNDIKKSLKSENQNVIDILKRLEKLEVISFIQNSSNNSIKFIQNRKDADSLDLKESDIQNDINKAKKNIDSVISYLKNKEECRNKILLNYFDEDLENRCEVCDNCIKINKEKIKNKSFEGNCKKILSILEGKEKSYSEIERMVNDEDKKLLKNVINYLFDNDFIYKFGNKYLLNEKNKFNL